MNNAPICSYGAQACVVQKPCSDHLDATIAPTSSSEQKSIATIDDRLVLVSPLADFISDKGRLGAARLIGCTGPALTKALTAGRTIFVELAGDGSVTAFEVSKFPGR